MFISNKLLEWLVDRKKVPVDWKKPLAAIRAKIAEALTDLPQSEEIQKFIEGKGTNTQTFSVYLSIYFRVELL